MTSGDPGRQVDPFASLRRDPPGGARRDGSRVPLHSEHDVVVTGTAPWGATVRLPAGVAGFLDQLQGGASLAVGATCHVVVVDDARDPVRVSALSADLDVARRLRGVRVPAEENATTQEWDVLDRGGFARLRLGVDVDDVRGRLGAYVTFRRVPDGDETAHFVDAGVLATYGVDRRMTFVEVVEPASPRIAGVPLLGDSLDDAGEALAAHGVEVVRDADGGTVVGWGVGLDAPDGTVEGVSFGEPPG